ncbi:Septum site-determining protein MinC [Patescibacteria group bacterium]|nr:Septum site-determining protein MinC [Patescibacteria group bacterium]
MPNHASTLEFKSGSFSVPILVLFTDDLKAISEKLNEKVELAPEFFRNSPLIFDVHELNKQSCSVDIPSLVKVIRQSGLLPTGMRGGNAEQNKQALELLIPIYSAHVGSSSSSDAPKAKITTPETEKVAESVNNTTMLITRPVRSGQRIYAVGDLVVVATVSAGAEIMAEGNIHVYGTLRGRALAGVLGNTDARIFCSDLQAELISIAGNYKISEDISTASKKPMQVYLKGHTLVIQDIV